MEFLYLVCSLLFLCARCLYSWCVRGLFLATHCYVCWVLASVYVHGRGFIGTVAMSLTASCERPGSVCGGSSRTKVSNITLGFTVSLSLIWLLSFVSRYMYIELLDCVHYFAYVSYVYYVHCVIYRVYVMLIFEMLSKFGLHAAMFVISIVFLVSGFKGSSSLSYIFLIT